MRALDEIRTIFAKFADRITTSRRLSQFNCGHCGWNERCGLPPDDKCIMKALQMTRHGEHGAWLSGCYYSTRRVTGFERIQHD